MKRTYTITICDNCHRDERDEGIDFAVSNAQADICLDCADLGAYFCKLCRSVHTADNLCEQAQAQEAEMTKWVNDHQAEIKAAQAANDDMPF